MLHGLLLLVIGAPWSEPTRTAFRDACVEVMAATGRERGADFCGCLLRETEERVAEVELLAFLAPEPSPTDAKVARETGAAVTVCRAEMAGSVDI